MNLIPKKVLCCVIAFAILLSEIFPVAAFADTFKKLDSPSAENNVETVYDLVAIVVDNNLNKDLSSYAGLKNSYPAKLPENTLGERVLRYAEDIRSSNKLTDVRVLLFDKTKETIQDLANTLETFYAKGDGTHKNRLVGVVLVGDIPLPVVNDNGKKSISVFPYTDFEDKTYIYNPETKTYDKNSGSLFPKPEIWHGIMRAPKITVTGNEEFAQYLDKNHLYYLGVPEFSKFDKRMFFGDLAHEEESLNKDVYKNYLKYLGSLGDLAYERYNKFWAQEVAGDSMAAIQNIPDEIKSDNPDAKKFMDSLKDADTFSQMPDIYTKQIIDQFLIPYFKVLSGYISKINDFADSTSRYSVNEVDSPPVLIAMKDEYVKRYLKAVNGALGKNINSAIEKIEEPVPLIMASNLSGNFMGPSGAPVNFGVSFKQESAEKIASGISIKYNYLNEATGEFYINGVNADTIQNAKQCGAYLGSTKSEYFDKDQNYNPKAVNGKYSILTRALRSNDVTTNMPIHTAGVNTRVLDAKEAAQLTQGQSSSGAVIEDAPQYGISSFIDNPLTQNYKNPLKIYLQKGDVITEVNGQKIDENNTFDSAIEQSYGIVKKVIDKMNNGGYLYLGELKLPKFVSTVAYFGDDNSIGGGGVSSVVGNFRVDFFRGGQKYQKNFTFTVDKYGKTSTADSQGDNEMIVLLSKTGFPEPKDLKNNHDFFDTSSNGAIFTLYDTNSGGFSGKGYDLSAGCNANSTRKNSDRCFAKLALMPVLDPAGATTFIKANVPGSGVKLMFPENVNKNDENKNSGNPDDYKNSMEILQFPGGKDNFNNIDDVYLNSCYAGLPSLDNLNPYKLPLDPYSNNGIQQAATYGLYETFLKAVGDFIFWNGTKVESSPSKKDVWMNMDALDSSAIVLNNLGENSIITLKDFSDRYGLFDGIDNDGNGIVDYQMKDFYLANGEKGQDGVPETKVYDAGEADLKYGIPSKNLEEIYRKMLSHNSSYVIPAELSSIKKEMILNVTVDPYKDKKLSSLIFHNEPTDYTLDKQKNSFNTLSTPIDSPRYAAFQTAPKPNASTGTIQTIVYPNLFEMPNYAQTQVSLDQTAWKLAQTDGSYRIFGTNADPKKYQGYSGQKLIHDEILNKYLSPAVTGSADDPVSGIDLKTASMEKIYDALNWLNMDIDNKHEYILKKYLNPKEDAFVGDKNSGYESAYFVFNGKSDYFDMSFNKDVPEENNKAFSPFATEETAAFSPEPTAPGGPGEKMEKDNNDEFLFVDLKDFLKESQKFLDYFKSKPNFKKVCPSGETPPATSKEKEEPSETPANQPVAEEANSLAINAESFALVANNQSKTKVTITAKDKDGYIANNSFVKVSIFTSGKVYVDPALDMDSDLPGIQMIITEGTVGFDLFSKNEIGTANVVALMTDETLEQDLKDVAAGKKELDFSKYAGDLKKFDVYDKVDLKLTPEKSSVTADGKSVVQIKSELLHDGKTVASYNGPINFSIANSFFGKFSDTPPKNMVNGVLNEANVKFVPSFKAGMAEIIGEIPGFTSNFTKINLLPDYPYRIKLTASSDTIKAGTNEDVILKAEIFDKNGNLVTTDNKTLVSFQATDATKYLVVFSGAQKALALNGVASTTIKATDFSGTANLTAEADNIKSGITSLKISKRIFGNQAKSFSPRTLYVSLAGGNFGNLGDEENLAESFLFSGQVQAVSAFTSQKKENKKLLNVDGYGKIESLADFMASKIIPATSSFPYQKIIFSDSLHQTSIASVFIVPKTNAQLSLVDDLNSNTPDQEGIFVKRTIQDKALTFIKKDDGIYIDRGGKNNVKIDNFGRISVNDSSIELRLPEKEDQFKSIDFAIVITENKLPIAAVVFKQNFVGLNGESQSIKQIPSGSDISSFYPGIYLKLDSPEKKYDFEQSFSRDSTDNSLGVYLTDNSSEEEISAIDNNLGAGFEGNNKNMLLFSAGNSVGESNIPYASEFGITYGDPTIKLNVAGVSGLVSDLSGYTKDIGIPIFAGQDEIRETIKFDYNNDGRDDILLVYENGLIRLLQNEISNKKFRDKGYILNVYGGILSAAKIDVNNDGYDDLLVGTKESCKATEKCLSLFTNNNGHFERQTLNLGIDEKAYKIKTADMNNDGCDDAVISDFGGNLRIFYNKNDGKKCKGLETNYGNTFSFDVPVKPKIDFETGNNFTTYKTASGNDVPPDTYPDIRIITSATPKGVITYLYSQGPLSDKGYVQYGRYDAESSGNNLDDLYNDFFKKNGLPDLKDLANGVSPDGSPPNVSQDAAEKLKGLLKGGQKKEDPNLTLADQAAQYIQDFTQEFRCSGQGCLPIPYNYAFLVPNSPSAGITVPGIAAIAFGTPYPPYFSPIYPSNLPSSFRIYVSPTLTMGLGVAICAGPPTTPAGGVAPCFAVAIPTKFISKCPGFLCPINDAIKNSKSNSFDPSTGMSTVVSNGAASTDPNAISSNGNSSSGPVSESHDINIKIPGFPSAITNWLDKETDEIFTKLLDLPDFYFIYPDIKNFISDHVLSFGNFNKIKNVHDFLRAVNSIPLIQIEGKEVLVKVPAISKAEVEKWKRQADQWIKYEEDQINKIKEFWTCDVNEYRKTLCDKVTVNMQDTIKAVKKFMDNLDKLAEIPNQILTWRMIESKYATQIICYLDAIMKFTGGYMKKQSKIVESWVKAVDDVVKTFKSWKAILDLSAEYQKSCDSCKNDRFSKLGILLNFFLKIPDPPIIPMPKWPDIVFDMSQIKTGVKIVWPDVVFKPQPINLPNLPTITIPDFLPDVVLNIPKINLPDFDVPDFVMPNLPDLPALPLPDLPDLPRPPKIPSIPELSAKLTTNLKPILKILCLIKKGLFIVNEGSLGAEIETLTQPSVQSVLPLLKEYGVQIPPVQYDYVEQIRLTLKMNFGIDTSLIYNVSKLGADNLNEKTKNLVENINKYTSFPLQGIIDAAIKQADDKAKEKIKKEIDKGLGKDEPKKQSSIPNSHHSTMYVALNEFSNSMTDFIKTMPTQEDYPDKIYLTAKEKFIARDDPILNQPLASASNHISTSDLPDTPEMKRLVNLRESFVAYTNNLNSSNELLRTINDSDNFANFLVKNDSSFIASIPSTESTPAFNTTNSTKFSFFGEGTMEYLKKEFISGRLLADNQTSGNAGKSADNAPAENIGGSAGASPAATVPPKGFYIAVGDKNESVLSYTKELDKKVTTMFTDVDGDSDTDIVYSMGGDVYLKTNYKNSPSMATGDLVIDPSKISISDFKTAGGTSVQNVAVTYENNKKADLAWSPKNNDTKSYEIEIRTSLDDASDKNVFAKYSSDKPSISLDIANGNYYLYIYAINQNGEKSLGSFLTIIAPSECADKEPPLPAVTQTKFDVPLFKTLEIDASGSFDTNGEVQEYYLELGPQTLWSDLNLNTDENGDGILTNDKTNPKFNVGPFTKKEDIGIHKAVLHVVDQSGNSSKLEISINVFAPKIKIDKSLSQSAEITGAMEPKIANLPFSLMRKRYAYQVSKGVLTLIPKLEKILTKSVSTDGKYHSDSGGDYKISDLNTDNMILIKNDKGEIVAEINPDTGNIGNLKKGFKVNLNPANPGVSSANVSITDEDNHNAGTIYFVADQNTDVTVNIGGKPNYTTDGVVVTDLDTDDDFEFEKIPSDNSSYPGGAIIRYKAEKKNLGVIDTSGNTLIGDSRLTLSKKENDHKSDPFIMDIKFENKTVGELYVGPSIHTQIVGPNDVPSFTPRTNLPSVSSPDLSGDDAFQHIVDLKDSDTALKQAVKELMDKGIISGIKTDGNDLLIKPDEKTTRSEFVKTLLKMLCITPRPEAYKSYYPNEAGGGFSDIKFNSEKLDWFYPYIKEAALRNLIHGYKGEIDATSKLPPFKPNETITRAEAVKIIMEAMEMEGIVDLSTIKIGTPWYDPFIDAAEDLSPYMKKGAIIKNNFIITPEEAKNPEEKMTRRQLIEMTVRVLGIYNCFEVDKNNNGIPDLSEQDTDKGGLSDAEELKLGTDIFNPADDKKILEIKNQKKPEIKKQPIESVRGIYIVPPECNTCPCKYTLEFKADIMKGDTFFTVVSSYDDKYIFSKSDDLVISEVVNKIK